MAFLHKLHKCRYNALAAVPHAAFLVLVLVFSIFLATHRRGNHVEMVSSSGSSPSSDQEQGHCQELQHLKDHSKKCLYLQSHAACAPQGYVDYLRLFYCGFGGEPVAGYPVFVLWLVVLFYLLGDTASAYFCASLEGLSGELRLPPAIAGVTLLSLGNGAPDVFSSVVSFAYGGDGAGDVGLNSVLGGALFVSTVVAGVVAVAAGRLGAAVERRGFVRDICFLLAALCYLLAVLLHGSVTIWAAVSFLSLYAAYVVLVWTSHCCAPPDKPSPDLAAPLLLDPPSLPSLSDSKPPTPRTYAHCLLGALQLPLYLPRRLTIPDIAAHRWSKPYAVASAFLSPLLLAAIWASPDSVTAFSDSKLAVLLSGGLLGLLLAVAAVEAIDAAAPPRGRWLRMPWLAGGFLMSVLWSYMLARELVALLVAIGHMLSVRASILGVTVLAWGNSLGDLVSNMAMALHGGPGGAQTAVSGCYAGPVFNTVIGLGLSMTLACAARYPEPFVLPVDGSVYETMGFLAAGLVWALMAAPMRGMRLDKVFGVGLLVIYAGFLGLRLCDSIEVCNYSWMHLHLTL